MRAASVYAQKRTQSRQHPRKRSARSSHRATRNEITEPHHPTIPTRQPVKPLVHKVGDKRCHATHTVIDKARRNQSQLRGDRRQIQAAHPGATKRKSGQCQTRRKASQPSERTPITHQTRSPNPLPHRKCPPRASPTNQLPPTTHPYARRGRTAAGNANPPGHITATQAVKWRCQMAMNSSTGFYGPSCLLRAMIGRWAFAWVSMAGAGFRVGSVSPMAEGPTTLGRAFSRNHSRGLGASCVNSAADSGLLRSPCRMPSPRPLRPPSLHRRRN